MLVYFAERLPHNASAQTAYTLMLEYWKEHQAFLGLMVRNRLTQFLLVMGKEFVLQEDFSLFPGVASRDEDIALGQVGAVMSIVLRWHHFGYVTPTGELAVKCLKAIGLWEEPC